MIFGVLTFFIGWFAFFHLHFPSILLSKVSQLELLNRVVSCHFERNVVKSNFEQSDEILYFAMTSAKADNPRLLHFVRNDIVRGRHCEEVVRPTWRSLKNNGSILTWNFHFEKFIISIQTLFFNHI